MTVDPEDAPHLIDIGSGVQIRYTSWGPHEKVGLIEYHPCAGGGCRGGNLPDSSTLCGGGVLFDLPGVREAFPERTLWQVQSLEPLTISPSLQCGCKGCTHHGYIVDGRWRPC